MPKSDEHTCCFTFDFAILMQFPQHLSGLAWRVHQ